MIKKLQRKLTKLKLLLRFYCIRIYPAQNCYLTCADKRGGIGSQLHAMISTMAFARAINVTYAHSPFCLVDHNEENKEDWESQWNALFNLGRGEVLATDLSNIKTVHIKNHQLINFRKRKNTLFVVQQCHQFTDKFPNKYNVIRDDLRRKINQSFRTTDPQEINNACISIAVHIRRGDVGKDKHPERYTSNEVIERFISGISDTIHKAGLNCEFSVFSEGKPADFEVLTKKNVNFYLNHCPNDSFKRMTQADILLVAKSSFSYTAGIYSKGIILCQSFWHRPLKDWILLDNMGNFDKKLLLKRIKTSHVSREKRTCDSL